MKTISLFLLLMSGISGAGQHINYESIEDVYLFRLPLQPLNTNARTFRVSVTDLGNQLSSDQISAMEGSLSIPGFIRTDQNPALSLAVIISPLAITHKELRDKPFTVEKGGVKTIYHNYNYLLSCSLPTKVRVTLPGGQTLEQDLPAFFQTTYSGNAAKTESEMQDQWEKDLYYRNRLLKEHLARRTNELQDFISSEYGYSMVRQSINLPFIKDKHNEYADLNKASSLLQEIFLYTSNKEKYLDENEFNDKATEATRILEHALTEPDTKDRINNKVKAAINYNLAALAFCRLQLTKAEEHLSVAMNLSRNTTGVSDALLETIRDQKKRLAVHGLLRDTNHKPAQVFPQMASISSSFGSNYIVGQTNDTLSVNFIIPSADVMPFGDSVWIQDQIIIANDGRPVELFPDQINGFCFIGSCYESLWWVEDTQTTPWTIARQFCKRIVTGAIPVFTCNEVTTDEEGYKTVRANLYYKQDDQYKPASFLNFNRGVSKLVSRHQDLSQKVKDGMFQRDDFIAIVQEYNKYQQPKTSH